MVLRTALILSAVLISVILLPLARGQEDQDGGGRIRQLARTDSRFQGEVRALEELLHEEELALLAQSVPPPVGEPIAPVKDSQPVCIGRVVSSFKDGPRILLSLKGLDSLA